MGGLNDLRLCVDRVVPDALAPARAASQEALQEAANAVAERSAERNLAGDSSGLSAITVARLALPKLKMWANGKTLRCRFLDGSDVQHRRVEVKARLWEQYANISFMFGIDPDAEIRISFSEEGSWSAVGTDCLITAAFPSYQPTMNFGWLKDDTDDDEYERVVVHEFGHALGAIHEHQQPHAELKWNKPEVYRVYSGGPNFWSRSEIEHNIFDRYSAQQTNSTEFDPDSIMLYAFPDTLFLDGHGTHSNTHLSERDEAFISEMYPKPSPGRPRTLRLRTPFLEGKDVEELQRRLQDLGFGPVGRPGVYDPETAAAVRRFQRANHLRADGVFGPKTRKAMAIPAPV